MNDDPSNRPEGFAVFALAAAMLIVIASGTIYWLATRDAPATVPPSTEHQP